MSQSAPKVSILSDGIGTFEGHTHKTASLYSPSYSSYAGFGTADGTWWMQVTKELGGTFLATSSCLGAYVSCTGFYSATVPGRIWNLSKDGQDPDIVLIYTGINDVANDVPLDIFRRDFADMLKKVKKFQPQAQVWVGTLVLGENPNHRPDYYPPEAYRNIADYNQVIRDCVGETDYHLADFAAQKVTYDSVNGLHPNKEGMITFAKAWLEVLKKDL